MARRSQPVVVRSRRASAVVEFAISLPVLVLMLLGTIEFGNYFSQMAIVKNCARDAARFGSNQSTLTAAQTEGAAAARTLLSDMGFPCGSGCGVDSSISQDAGINFIRVAVDVPYVSVTGVIPAPYDSAGVVRVPLSIPVVALYPMVGP